MIHYFSDSLSAWLQTKLIIWRNPQGQEENWITQRDKYKKFPPVWTVVKCEGAFTLLAGVGFGEYATSCLMFPVGYAVSCISSKPYEWVKHWNECSKIAALWAISNLSENVTKPNMITTPENFQIEQNQDNLLMTPFTLTGKPPL